MPLSDAVVDDGEKQQTENAPTAEKQYHDSPRVSNNRWMAPQLRRPAVAPRSCHSSCPGPAVAGPRSCPDFPKSSPEVLVAKVPVRNANFDRFGRPGDEFCSGGCGAEVRDVTGAFAIQMCVAAVDVDDLPGRVTGAS